MRERSGHIILTLQTLKKIPSPINIEQKLTPPKAFIDKNEMIVNGDRT